MLIAYAVAAIVVIGSLSLHVYGYVANAGARAQFGSVLEVLAIAGSLGGVIVLVTACTLFATGGRKLRATLVAFVAMQTIFGVSQASRA